MISNLTKNINAHINKNLTLNSDQSSSSSVEALEVDQNPFEAEGNEDVEKLEENMVTTLNQMKSFIGEALKKKTSKEVEKPEITVSIMDESQRMAKDEP